jgi:hypothetical protein
MVYVTCITNRRLTNEGGKPKGVQKTTNPPGEAGHTSRDGDHIRRGLLPLPFV